MFCQKFDFDIICDLLSINLERLNNFNFENIFIYMNI